MWVGAPLLQLGPPGPRYGTSWTANLHLVAERRSLKPGAVGTGAKEFASKYTFFCYPGRPHRDVDTALARTLKLPGQVPAFAHSWTKS